MALAAILLGADSFRVAGNYTANFVVGRKVRANCAGDGYRFGYVSASAFAAGNTDVDLDQIVDDAGNDDVLTANLATVEWSVVGIGSTGNQFVPREIDIERYTNFSDAIDSIGGDDRTLVISTVFAAAVNKTAPANVTLKINQAGRLAPAAGVTITIASQPEAGLYQIFAGDGDVLFSATVTVYPEWWGAVGDESADDQPAIQAAINFIGPYFATVAEYNASLHEKGEVLLTNRYRVDSTVELYDGISFRGLNPPSHGGTYYTAINRPRRAGTQIVSNIQDGTAPGGTDLPGSNIIEVIGTAAEPDAPTDLVWYEGYIGGFTIWGTGATGIPNYDGHGLAFLADAFAFSTVENLLIRGCGGNGFHVAATCGWWYNTVHNVVSVRSGGRDGGHNFHLDGNGIYQTHNYFEHCQSSGGIETHGWYLDTWRGCTFIDCIGEGAREINWYLKDVFQCKFFTCTGEVGADVLHETALELDGCSRNTFSGCSSIGTPIAFTDSSDNVFLNHRVGYRAADITGATQANPCVVTAVGSNLIDGQIIHIREVVGMIELNEPEYTVANATADTFELLGINSGPYAAYVAGGHVLRAYLYVFDSDSDRNAFFGTQEGGGDLSYNEFKDEGSWNRIIARNHNWVIPQTQDHKPVNRKYRPPLILDGGFEYAGAGAPDIWKYWTETASDGALANETTIVHAGDNAAKITAGPTLDTRIGRSFDVVPYGHYWFVFFTQGDGANAGEHSVYDQTNGVFIIPQTSTGVTAAAWTLVEIYWTAPALCVRADVRLWCPNLNGAIAYFDDVDVREN